MFLLLFSLLYNNCCISIFKCNIFSWFCLNLWCIFKNVYCFRAEFFQFFFFIRSYYSKWNMRRTISFSLETQDMKKMRFNAFGMSRHERFFFFWLHDWDWLQASGKIKMFILFVIRPTQMERIPNIFESLVMPADIVEFNCFISTALTFFFYLYSSYFGVNNRMWINNRIVRALDEWTRAFEVNCTHELWNF